MRRTLDRWHGAAVRGIQRGRSGLRREGGSQATCQSLRGSRDRAELLKFPAICAERLGPSHSGPNKGEDVARHHIWWPPPYTVGVWCNSDQAALPLRIASWRFLVSYLVGVTHTMMFPGIDSIQERGRG